MPQLLFGGILAVMMLVLYGYSIYEAIELAKQCGDIPNCTKKLPENISLVFNLVGGLISATVIAVLGSTKRGDFPAQKSFEKNLEGFVAKVAGFMPSVFILFWIICGAAILFCGWFPFDNEPVPALSAQAKAWIGIAIGAVYAYMGITPDGKPVERPAIAEISIEPKIELISGVPQALTATAKDDNGNAIPNLPSDRFEWTSDNPNFATVDEKGLVTWVATGVCNVTATANANAVASNKCAVTCT